MGVRAVRHHRARQLGGAAGGGRRRLPGAGHQPRRRRHHRLQRPPHVPEPARGSDGRGRRGRAQPGLRGGGADGGHQLPQLRQSPSSPTSATSSARRCSGCATRAPTWRPPSPAATCRSTTRPTGRPSTPRRSSAWSASSRTSARWCGTRSATRATRSSCWAPTRANWAGRSTCTRCTEWSPASPRKSTCPAERALQRCLLAMAGRRVLKSAHDVASGGLAATLVESCLGRPRTGRAVGASVRLEDELPDAALLFGEDHGRVVVSCGPDEEESVRRMAEDHGVPCERIGTVAGAESPLEIRTESARPAGCPWACCATTTSARSPRS